MLQSIRQRSTPSLGEDGRKSPDSGNRREKEVCEESVTSNSGCSTSLGRRAPPRKGSFGRLPPPGRRSGSKPTGPRAAASGTPGSSPPSGRGPPPPSGRGHPPPSGRGRPPGRSTPPRQPGARSGFPAPPPRGGVPPRTSPRKGGSVGRKTPLVSGSSGRNMAARRSPPSSNRRSPPSSNSSTTSPGNRSISKSSANFQPGAANQPRTLRQTSAFTRPPSASVGGRTPLPDHLRGGSNSNSRSRSQNARSMSRSSMKRNTRVHSRSNSSVNSQEIARFNSSQNSIDTSPPSSDLGERPSSMSSNDSERESSSTSTRSESPRSDSGRSSDAHSDTNSNSTNSQQEGYVTSPTPSSPPKSSSSMKRSRLLKHSQTIAGLPSGVSQAHSSSASRSSSHKAGRKPHHKHSQTMMALPAFTMSPPSRPPPRATRTSAAATSRSHRHQGTFLSGPTSPTMNGDFFASTSTANVAPSPKKEMVPKGSSPHQWKRHLSVMAAIRRSVRKGTHPKAHLVEVLSSTGYEPPSIPKSSRTLSPLKTGLRFLDRSKSVRGHTRSQSVGCIKEDSSEPDVDVLASISEEKSEFLPKAFTAVESYAQVAHQYPAVQHKVNSGLELIRTMDGFMQKYYQSLEKFAQEVSKAAVTYQKKLDASPEGKTNTSTVSWRACHQVLQNVRDVSSRQLVLAQRVTMSSSKMSTFRQQGAKLSDAYTSDRAKIREKLNHDVRALEKSRTRAQKALSDATQTQMNHLIAKTKEQQRILSAVQSQGNSTPKSSKTSKTSIARSKSKLEKSKESMLAKQEEAHSFAKSHAANINIYNKRLTFFHDQEIPSVFLHMQALDESRINTLKDSLNDFVGAQKEFGQEYVKFGYGLEHSVNLMDVKDEQSEFLAQSVEKYGPFRGIRRLKYDLQRTPSNIRSIQDKIRLETGGPSFEEMLHENSLLRTYFRQFLKDTYSLENFQFYRSVEDYHTISEDPTRSLRAKEIFETYVRDDAPKCINIQNHEREFIVKNWEKFERSLFDAAAASVRHLMKTCSYKEFLGSKTYESYLSEISQL